MLSRQGFPATRLCIGFLPRRTIPGHTLLRRHMYSGTESTSESSSEPARDDGSPPSACPPKPPTPSITSLAQEHVIIPAAKKFRDHLLGRVIPWITGGGLLLCIDDERRTYWKRVCRDIFSYPFAVQKTLWPLAFWMFFRPSSTADLVDKAEGELELDQLSDQAIRLSVFLREKLADMGEEDLAIKKLRRELELVAAGAGKHSGEERGRLLRWAVSIQVRLGNLYLSIDRPEEAAEQLMKAAETSKLEKWGVVKDKVVWSGTEEVVSSLEQLGNYYAKHEKYPEAFDAYCEAVSLVPPISCERVTLLNHMAKSCSQLPIPPRAEQKRLEEATILQIEAIETANVIKGRGGNTNIDRAHEVAWRSLGAFTKQLGKAKLGLQMIKEAEGIAEALVVSEPAEVEDGVSWNQRA